MSSIAPTTGGHPPDFTNPYRFANSYRFANPVAAVLRNGHDWRFPLEFSPNQSWVVAGFGTIAFQEKRDRHDWRFPLSFFPNGCWVIASFGKIMIQESEMAMIGGFRGNFPKGVELSLFWHEGEPRKA